MVKLLRNKAVSVSLSVISSVGLVTMLAYATSIGSDVSVTGALTTTGAATFNGAMTLGDAVGDTLTVNGRFAGFVSTASSTIDGAFTATGATALTSTLTVTGATVLNGAVTLGDAVGDTVTVNGVIAGFVSNASSTISTGVFNVGSASFGVATSTPAQEIGLTGDVFQVSAATTTHFLSSTNSNAGGCIEMLRSNGTKVRIYIGASTTAQKTDTNFLIVEAGVCQ